MQKYDALKSNYPFIVILSINFFIATKEVGPPLYYKEEDSLLAEIALDTEKVLTKKYLCLRNSYGGRTNIHNRSTPTIKVCILSSAPAKPQQDKIIPSCIMTAEGLRYTKSPTDPNAPAVLFMYSSEKDPGGIILRLVKSKNEKFKEINFLQAQWPAASLKEKGVNFESDAIPKSSYLDIGKYYAELFKKLKEESGGKLHIAACSSGAMRALLGYLSMTEEEQEGLSVSLVDPFIPSEYPAFKFSNSVGAGFLEK